MKLRRAIISIFAMLLVVSSLQVSAFAEEEHYYNLYADIMPHNEDCLQLDTLKDVKDAKLTITKNDDPSISATLSLKYDDNPYWKDMWGIDYQDTPEMRAILADLIEKNQAKKSSLRTKKRIKSELTAPRNEEEGKRRTKAAAFLFEDNTLDGYTVTVEGLGDHFEVKNYSAYVTSAEDIQNEMAEMTELIKDYGGKAYADYQQPATYLELMNDYAKVKGYDSYEAMLKSWEDSAEEIEESMDEVAEMDDILIDIQNGTFYGQLDIEGYMYCDCPMKTECYLLHNYYKMLDGKRTLIYSQEEDVEVFVGETVYAKDYLKLEHDGETYVWTDCVGMFSDKQMDELIITDDLDSETGFILSYDCVKAEGGAAAGDDDQQEKPNRKPEVVTGEDGPNTGDYTPMGVYLALILLAAGGCMAAVRYRKR